MCYTEFSAHCVWNFESKMITKNMMPVINQISFGPEYGRWLVACVIGCFLLGPSVASERFNDGDAVYGTTDPLVLNCTAPKIMSRKDWLAMPPQKPLDKLKLPVPKVIIAHTATELCKTEAECVYQVRLIQTFHIESRGWDDIAYNFLVGGDGAVYVGRSWNYAGAHTKGYNKESIGIAFIGTFNQVEPTQQQLCAAQKLLEQGLALGMLANDYELYGHRQLMSTTSPGNALYKIIQTWKHWRKTF